jgi:hypothetical protein
MWLCELFARLDAMAFKRKVIVDKLRALQPQINAHALKIIVYPEAPQVPHWKQELSAWGNDLTEMQLRGVRGVSGMGFALAWKHLYREPFEGGKDTVLRLKLERIARQYARPISKQPPQVMAELVAFLRPFCAAIGRNELVDPVVERLGQPSGRV